MLSLNDALEDLGRIRVRTKACDVDFDLSPAKARACIDIFANSVSTMIVPDDFMHSMTDMNLLRALPDVIDSPYVNTDPGMRIV